MALAPIPLATPIVDKLGRINIFFRERWEELRTLSGFVAARTLYAATAQGASIATHLLLTVVQPGIYRVTFSARRTVADGVSSSLTFVWHWTDAAIPLSLSAPANTTDTTGALYTGTALMKVDVNTNLTCDMTYASNTPGAMKYQLDVIVEQIGQG